MPRGFQPPSDEQRCVATVTHGPRKGERCPKYHIKGSTVCQQHGGLAPQVKEAARRRVEEAETRELAAKVDVELPEFRSAADAARYLLGETTKRSAQFAQLADAAALTYTDRAGQQRLSAAILGQRQWMDSVTRVLSAAAAAEQASKGKGATEDELDDLFEAFHVAFSHCVHSAFSKAAWLCNTAHPQEPEWQTREFLPGTDPGYILMLDKYRENTYKFRVADTAMVEEVREQMLASFRDKWMAELRWRWAEKPEQRARRRGSKRDRLVPGEVEPAVYRREPGYSD